MDFPANLACLVVVPVVPLSVLSVVFFMTGLKVETGEVEVPTVLQHQLEHHMEAEEDQVLLFVIAFLLPLAVTAVYGLEFFVGAIQAAVFGLLTLTFMAGATQSHDDEH